MAKPNYNKRGAQVPQFDVGPGSHYITILCPHCNMPYLNKRQVDVYERSEDAKAGTHVSISSHRYWGNTITKEKVHVDTKSDSVDDGIRGNPSRRRDGLVVSVVCEDCQEKSRLCIYDHKGEVRIDIVKGAHIDGSI